MVGAGRHAALVGATVIVLLGAVSLARAAGGLQTADNPGGGEIVYGPLDGISSLSEAMVEVLRTVHGHFDDRPRVGKFLQARDGRSVATFFSVTDKSQNGRAFAGLAIVTLADGNASGAVLYDDAARFAKTEPAMMKTLGDAWHLASPPPPLPGAAPKTEAVASAGGAAVAPSGSSATSTPLAESPSAAAAAAPVAIATRAGESAPAHLHMTTGGDHSASVGLPEGWRLTGVSGGQLTAEGPKGEMAGLGIMLQGIRNPGGPRPMFAPPGGGAPLVAPFGGDLFASFDSLTNQVRRNKHLPPATYKLTKSENLPANQYEQRVVQAIFEVDLHDGKGRRKGSARIGAMHVRGVPTWALTISSSNAPVAVAEAEGATLLAVVRSYRQDGKVIAQETQQVIGRINANANAARIRANAQSAANDAHNRAFDQHMADLDSRNQAFDQHMDNIDRSSKSFQNYLLDRNVVQDNDYNERGTVGNGYGDALVKSNPDRFQYVQQKDFIKGVDY